jgi:hypothetical protein
MPSLSGLAACPVSVLVAADRGQSPTAPGTSSRAGRITACVTPIGLATPSFADTRHRPTMKARISPAMAKVMFPNALPGAVHLPNHASLSGFP